MLGGKAEELGDNDRFSRLPVDLIDKILELLPHHEAARTSMLSRLFLEHWRRRQLVRLDSVFWRGVLSTTDGAPNEVFIQTIDRELRSHLSFMDTFILDLINVETFPGYILAPLEQKQLKTIILDANLTNTYIDLPLVIYNYTSVKILSLVRFSIPPQIGYPSFTNLTSIFFIDVCITGRTSKLSNLREVFLLNCVEIENLNWASSHGLRTFSLQNSTRLDSTLLEGHALTDLCLVSSRWRDNEGFSSDWLFRTFPNLESLRLDGHFIQSIIGQSVPRGFYPGLSFLTNLSLTNIYVSDYNQTRFLMCLMRSVTSLCNIEVKYCIFVGDLETYIEPDFDDVLLPSLRTAQIWVRHCPLPESLIARVVIKKGTALQSCIWITNDSILENYWRDNDTALFILEFLYRNIPDDPIVVNERKDNSSLKEKIWPDHRRADDEVLPLTFADRVFVRNFSQRAKKIMKK